MEPFALSLAGGVKLKKEKRNSFTPPWDVFNLLDFPPRRFIPLFCGFFR